MCISLHWPRGLRLYIANKKTRILIGTVIEVEIGPKATELGRRRTFVVAKFDLGRGDMTVATISIKSLKIHTPEPHFLILVVMVGRGLILPPQLLLATQLSQIQSMFKVFRRQHQIL